MIREYWAAVFRAVGQLALLVYATRQLSATAHLILDCAPQDSQCRLMLPDMAALAVPSAVGIAVALLGWWATCRQSRSMLAVISVAVLWLMCVLAPVMLIVAVPLGWLTGNGPWVATNAQLVWIITPAALLLLSYSENPPLDERGGTAGWVWIVLVPLAALTEALYASEITLRWLPPLTWIGALLAAGLLYRVLRRRRAAPPAAARWLPVTGLLTACSLPEYTCQIWWIDPSAHNAVRVVLGWIVAVCVVVTLGVLHLRAPTGRRTRSLPGAPWPTLIKRVAGIYPMDSCHIRLGGGPVTIHSPSDAAAPGTERGDPEPEPKPPEMPDTGAPTVPLELPLAHRRLEPCGPSRAGGGELTGLLGIHDHAPTGPRQETTT